MDLSDCFSETLTSVCAPNVISCDSKLTEETIRDFAFAGTVNEKDPSVFVTVPVFVPLTITEALAIGLPLSSITFPIIVRWAHSELVAIIMTIISSTAFLMCMCFRCDKMNSPS
jgi:hypothetical protein